MITTGFGIGMFIYGMTCILIGAIIAYYIINKTQKTKRRNRTRRKRKIFRRTTGETIMKLSRNFSLSELIKSDTAIRLGIDNNPNADQIEKLKLLCENILQPVRDHFGRVTVTSCFRSPELCVKIGSSLNSQHTRAEAADFECLGTSNAEVFDWIKANLPYDQMISRVFYSG